MDNTFTEYSTPFARVYFLSAKRILLKHKPRRRSEHSAITKRNLVDSNRYHLVISVSPMFGRNTKPRKMEKSESCKDCRSSYSDSGVGSVQDSDLLEICSSSSSCCDASNNYSGVDEGRKCGLSSSARRSLLTSHHVSISKYKDKKQSKESSSLDDVFDRDLGYDSDSCASISSRPKAQCTRCGCMPRFSWTRNRVTKSNSLTRKSRSSGSWMRADKDSVFKEFASRYGENSSEDDNRCLLNVLYSDHICIDSDFCNQKSLTALNAHLKSLVDCMPQPCYDQGLKRARNYPNCELEKAGYIPYRRNAVCETSEESRMKFYHALCSFMTLKALVRYDFL